MPPREGWQGSALRALGISRLPLFWVPAEMLLANLGLCLQRGWVYIYPLMLWEGAGLWGGRKVCAGLGHLLGSSVRSWAACFWPVPSAPPRSCSFPSFFPFGKVACE